MNELRGECAAMTSEAYVQRVTCFLRDASGWCRDRGLSVEDGVVTLREERMDEYQAPSLYISKDGVSLARILPVGSRTVGAQGRVDLIGRVARHALLFYGGKGPVLSMPHTVGQNLSGPSLARMPPGVDGDGWYWIESTVLRPKRVEESLFVDLLTDVSDYEFR